MSWPGVFPPNTRAPGPLPSPLVTGWKAWYDADRTFSSATTAWDDLPDFGVLVINLYEEEGWEPSRPSLGGGGVYRRMMAGTEYYTSDGAKYAHGNTDPGWGSVKRAPAALIPQDEYNAIVDEAMADRVAP